MRLGSMSVTMILTFCMLAQTQCPTEDPNPGNPTDPQTTPDTGSGDSGNDNGDGSTPVAPWDGAGSPVIINEVLAHSNDEAPDWIELHNRSGSPVDIGGWLLSDREDDLRKFQIPEGTVVEPLGYIVFYETTDFGNPLSPGALAAFALSENGETIFLYSGDDPEFPDILFQETLGASETDWSLGRHPTSDSGYRFPIMSRPTPGAANAYPLVGPIVINEILYDPAEDPDAEYVELLNISEALVTLYDPVSRLPWRFINDSGVELRFSANDPVTLGPGEYLLVARRADALSSVVPENVRVLEWRSGKLGNRHDTLLLVKPGDEDEEGTRYWIEVDRVDYSDGRQGQDFPNNDNVDPWPLLQEGADLSLNRILPSRYGNDPNQWRAAAPTPGAVNN